MGARRAAVFLTAHKNLVDIFVTPAGREKAAELGIELRVPAAAGDLPADHDWRGVLADCDAVVTTWGSPLCSAAFLAAAPKARIVGHAAGSVATVVDASTYAAGIKVVSANGVMATAVAEWSLLATLLAQRDLQAYAALRPGEAPRFDRQGAMMPCFPELTVGVWGYGDIARQFLEMLPVLRPGHVLVCSAHADAAELARLGARRATLEEVFARSDILHCLAGANRENHHRIGAAELALLKDGMVLVNAGRARLFQEQPLLEALRTRPIRAIIDVYHAEPPPAESPLFALGNVLLTPHNAGYPGRERYLPFVLDEFDRFFHSRPLRGEVTAERHDTLSDDRLMKQ